MRPADWPALIWYAREEAETAAFLGVPIEAMERDELIAVVHILGKLAGPIDMPTSALELLERIRRLP